MKQLAIALQAHLAETGKKLSTDPQASVIIPVEDGFVHIPVGLLDPEAIAPKEEEKK